MSGRPEEWNGERTIRELQETQKRVEGISYKLTKLQVEFNSEVEKRHEVHYHVKEQMKSQSDLLTQMAALHKDMKEAIEKMDQAIFGDEDLNIPGLMKDNVKTQKAFVRATYMWAGGCAVLSLVAALILNGVLKL